MSFLSDYRLYTSGNEAPPTYHTFSSLVALSSIVSRKVWVDMDYYSIYPNLYVVLVGPPGARKSSAMNTTKFLMRQLKNIPFSGECISKEKLIIDMNEAEQVIEGLPEDRRVISPMTICVTELSEFLQISAAGMIGFLTDVYDQDIYEHKTKNKGTVIINGPFLNLLACTTPSWITMYLRTDIISGGFSRRALFVYETEKAGRIAFPVITPEARAAWGRVIDAAQRHSKLKGPFKWTREAKEFYRKWYESLVIPNDENTVGYYETKHIQLLKVAMLIAISEDEVLELRVSHLEAGLKILGLVEQNLGRVFEGMGRNDLNSSATKLLEVLRRCPEQDAKDAQGHPCKIRAMPRKQLQNIMYAEVDQDTLEKMITHLIAVDKIGLRTFIDDRGTTREYIVLK